MHAHFPYFYLSFIILLFLIIDGDFLGRIQKLLSEPMIFPADSIDMDQSHATDSILEGDRPWEHTPTLYGH